MATALGGLLFGFDISVISGTIPFLQDYFNLTEAAKGWVVSSALAGCIIGALTSGRLGDILGRRLVLKICAVLFIISAIGSGLSTSIPSFIIYRLIGGFAVGGASVLAPVYIAEVSPAPLRGRIVSINQLTIVIGISLAYYSNYLLLNIVDNSWRWMFAVEAIPALVFFIALFFIPDSPRWLVKNNNEIEAERILKRISPYHPIESEMKEIKDSLKEEKRRAGFREILKPGLRRILFIGIILAVFQQWCGINVIFFYAPDIFASMDINMDAALFQTTLIGIVNILFTLIAMWLIDRIGRKILMITGSFIMSLGYMLIATTIDSGTSSYLLLAFILMTAGAFAATLGPVVWVVMSEIFPNRARGTGMAITTFFLWTACYILTLTFPMLAEGLGKTGTFIIYSIICIAGGLFVIFMIPETKERTLEELEKILIKK